MVRRCNLMLAVSPQACVTAAAALLLIPLPWVVAWFAAAAIHELSHCLMVLLCGRRIERIVVGGQGAEIITDYLTDVQTALCALAGSAGGLSLLMLAPRFPRLAVCALVQSVFNLLPVFPLDGGRALRAVCSLLFSCKAGETICSFVENTVQIMILLLGFVGTFLWKLGILPLMFSIFLLIYMKK